MKPTPLLIAVLFAGAVGSAHGQGTIQWGNIFTGTLRAPVYGPIPNYPTCRLTGNTPTGIPAGTQDYAGAPLLSGTGFTMAIFVGSSESEAWASISDLGSAPFRTGAAAGFVSARFVTDPTRLPGTTDVHVQFRVWDNQNGIITSWAQVLAAGGIVPFGYSDVFTIEPLGGTDPFGVVHATPQTTGVRSFNMFLTGGGPNDLPGCPVPEPSTWGLIATAAGLLFVGRRRRSRGTATRHTHRSGPADPAGRVLQATSLTEFTGRSCPMDFGRRGRLPHFEPVHVPICAHRAATSHFLLASFGRPG